MKKLKGIMLILILAVCSLFAFACKKDDAKATIQDVKVNGLSSFYYIDENVDYSNLSLNVTLSNKSKLDLNKVEFNVDLKDAKSDTQVIIYTNGAGLKDNDDKLIEGEYDIEYIIVGRMTEKAKLTTIIIGENQKSAGFTLSSFALPQTLVNHDNLEFDTNKDNEALFYEIEDTYMKTVNNQNKAVAVYYIGDDNEFIFKPNYRLFRNGQPTAINLNTVVEVALKNNDGSYTTVGSDYYTYNPATFGIDFVDGTATGKTFKITSKAKDFTRSSNGVAEISYEVVVADGWNINQDNVKDLGRINFYGSEVNAANKYELQQGKWDGKYQINGNNVENRPKTLWKEFLGVSDTVANSPINGIFLHDNIKLKASDIPSGYFVTAEEIGSEYDSEKFAAGSLRDFSTLYAKYMGANDFNFNGNFFTFDMGEFPIGLSNQQVGGIYYKKDLAMMREGHSRAFHFLGDVKENGADIYAVKGADQQGKVYFKNVNFIGNINYAYGQKNEVTGVYSNISGRTTPLAAEYSCGGIIGIAAEGLNANYENVIAKNLYIPYYADSNTVLNIKKSKAYDSFNCAVYSYHAPLTTVSKSEFKRFEGPALFINSGVNDSYEIQKPNDYIANYANYPSNNNLKTSNFIIDKDTVIENYIESNSAWFNLYSAYNAGIIVGNIVSENADDSRGYVVYYKCRVTGSEDEIYLNSKEIEERNATKVSNTGYINFTALAFNGVGDANQIIPATLSYDTENNFHAARMFTLIAPDFSNLTGNHYVSSDINMLGAYGYPVDNAAGQNSLMYDLYIDMGLGLYGIVLDYEPLES